MSDKIKFKEYLMPESAYLVQAGGSTSKDYTVFYKGIKINDVVAIVRVAK